MLNITIDRYSLGTSRLRVVHPSFPLIFNKRLPSLRLSVRLCLHPNCLGRTRSESNSRTDGDTRLTVSVRAEIRILERENNVGYPCKSNLVTGLHYGFRGNKNRNKLHRDFYICFT